MKIEAISGNAHVPTQSDVNLNGLIEFLSDWYWEQDENFRYTVLSGNGLKAAKIDTAIFLGTTRWGNGRMPLGAPGWDDHLALLAARQSFTDFVYKAVTPSDGVRYISTSGQPLFDQDGQFRGYRGVGKDVTQQVRIALRRDIEHAITRILATSNSIIETSPQIIQVICETLGWACGSHWIHDEDSNTLQCAETWGIPAPDINEFLESGKKLIHVMPLDPEARGLIRSAWNNGTPVWVRDVARDADFRRAVQATKAGLHSAFAFPIKNGTQVTGIMEFFTREIYQADNELLDCSTYIADQINQFSQLIKARSRLRQNEERFRSLTELSSDWLWEQDEQFRITFIEGAIEEKTGLGSVLRIGRRRWDFPALNLTEKDWVDHKALLARHEPFYDFEIRQPDFKGTQHWVSISGQPIFDAAGAFKGYRGVGKDISARKRTEERIHYLATHDGLTSLPNRALFNEILNQAIHAAQDCDGQFAVMFIDLDRFKLINDTLGHEAGDAMLIKMSKRILQCVGPGDVVARLGGDEFVVLLQQAEEANYYAQVANKLLSAIIKPITLQNQECRVTASIGICQFPLDARDEQSLMKYADAAMYRAKEEGKNNYQFYSKNIQSQSLERLALETSLRRAVERNQFFLHYQAKLDLATRKITGVEALLRWQHPDLGVISPLQFIPLAEETGLIVPIGRWVLQTACAHHVAWQRNGFPPLCMSVNLSARQFADEFLLDDIATALRESGMAPESLELELTESMVIQNPQRATKLLAAIKKMGVRLAIDDFGTGYSSLAQLKYFPIDTLKVDRSFIRDIPYDTDDMAMTKAIITMGKTLNMTVIAEGVETQAQEDFLHAHACDEIQGYYFSKPIPPDAFADLWRQHDNEK